MIDYNTMVCDGPDPPENNPQELTPPPRHDLMMNGNHGEESEDENDYFGYEPLPQGPEAVHSDHDSDDNTDGNDVSPANDMPAIETMDDILTRDVWSSPRSTDPIEMNSERAQQVMLAMANFSLPQTSIPEWAQSITEEQWRETLNDRIEKIKNNR